MIVVTYYHAKSYVNQIVRVAISPKQIDCCAKYILDNGQDEFKKSDLLKLLHACNFDAANKILKEKYPEIYNG